MKNVDCDFLDDYLTGDVDAETCRAFELHAASCQRCRSQVELQKTIDGMLAAANSSVQVSSELIDRIDRRIQFLTFRRNALAIAMVAAALVVIAVTVRWRHQDRPPLAKPSPHTTKKIAVSPENRLDQAPKPGEGTNDSPPGLETDPQVVVSFPDHQHIIAVEAPTTDPTVTIMFVYPTDGSPMFSRSRAQIPSEAVDNSL